MFFTRALLGCAQSIFIIALFRRYYRSENHFWAFLGHMWCETIDVTRQIQKALIWKSCMPWDPEIRIFHNISRLGDIYVCLACSSEMRTVNFIIALFRCCYRSDTYFRGFLEHMWCEALSVTPQIQKASTWKSCMPWYSEI